MVDCNGWKMMSVSLFSSSHSQLQWMENDVSFTLIMYKKEDGKLCQVDGNDVQLGVWFILQLTWSTAMDGK